jgi:hypothetical protein
MSNRTDGAFLHPTARTLARSCCLVIAPVAPTLEARSLKENRTVNVRFRTYRKYWYPHYASANLNEAGPPVCTIAHSLRGMGFPRATPMSRTACKNVTWLSTLSFERLRAPMKSDPAIDALRVDKLQ